MAWLPPPRGKLLDAAALKAAQMQRTAFLQMLGLRMGDVLHPLDPDRGPIGKEDVARVTRQISEEADALYAANVDALPADCNRAPVHLQMASLALASQRMLLVEAKRDEYVLCNALKVRFAVANALGVVAPPDGTEPQEVGGMWLPNKLSLLFTGALFKPERQRTIVERTMHNFEVDLGAGFEMAPLEPAPSRRMTRCFYASFLEAEAARDATAEPTCLVPVFQAMHGATFCGVPGFSFEPDASGHGGCFRFEEPPR